VTGNISHCRAASQASLAGVICQIAIATSAPTISRPVRRSHAAAGARRRAMRHSGKRVGLLVDIPKRNAPARTVASSLLRCQSIPPLQTGSVCCTRR